MHRCGFGSPKRRLRADITTSKYVNNSRKGSTVSVLIILSHVVRIAHIYKYIYIYIYIYIHAFWLWTNSRKLDSAASSAGRIPGRFKKMQCVFTHVFICTMWLCGRLKTFDLLYLCIHSYCATVQEKYTLLHQASKNGHLEVAKYLVENGGKGLLMMKDNVSLSLSLECSDAVCRKMIFFTTHHNNMCHLWLSSGMAHSGLVV